MWLNGICYVVLSQRWDTDQPYGFQSTLVTHVRANMEYVKSEGNQKIISYIDDAYAKFGTLLMEQGYSKEAETLKIKVLNLLDPSSHILSSAKNCIGTSL